MEKLFSNQYLHIFLHRTPHQTLELQWLDFVPSADYRRGIEELSRLAHQHQAKALVADNRLLRALRPTDLDWSGNLIFKGLSELGGRRLAVVESRDAMNRMGVTALVAILFPAPSSPAGFLPPLRRPAPGLPRLSNRAGASYAPLPSLACSCRRAARPCLRSGVGECKSPGFSLLSKERA